MKRRLQNKEMENLPSNQFDFAKEAVNLGVMEYLLKPVNRMKVIEVINRAVSVIKAEKEKRRAEMEFKEKLEMSFPYLKTGLSILSFLLTITAGNLSTIKTLIK